MSKMFAQSTQIAATGTYLASTLDSTQDTGQEGQTDSDQQTQEDANQGDRKQK
jgi:hypothetical protein